MNTQLPPNTQLPGSAQNGRDNEMRGKRTIEVGFPIVEINRLALPERNSFNPIYEMHKWFARRGLVRVPRDPSRHAPCFIEPSKRVEFNEHQCPGNISG